MPIVALVGRPNVGKSTLFNRLIGEHRAVVHEQPGTTRDRLYGTAEWRNREFTVIDTGGIGLDTGEGDLLADVRLQAEEAMREADIIVWVVDASTGLTAADDDVAKQLRPSKKPVILTANKADNQRRQLDAMAEFTPIGFGASRCSSRPCTARAPATCWMPSSNGSPRLQREEVTLRPSRLPSSAARTSANRAWSIARRRSVAASSATRLARRATRSTRRSCATARPCC